MFQIPGTAMSNTLKDIKKKNYSNFLLQKRMQMGMTLGLSMDNNIATIFSQDGIFCYME